MRYLNTESMQWKSGLENSVTKLNIFWFRRDLRLEDNHALSLAHKASLPILPVFIFDSEILESLPKNDSRISFIHQQLEALKQSIIQKGGDLLIMHGKPEDVFHQLKQTYLIQEVFCNEDYEPYALNRDHAIAKLLKKEDIVFTSVKDQVIFARDEVLKDNGDPYTVFTPYKKKYLSLLRTEHIQSYDSDGIWFKHESPFPSLGDLGFEQGSHTVHAVEFENIHGYELSRDYPSLNKTTRLGPHLRFGTLSTRSLFRQYYKGNETFISELIWREFFMQILAHFPHVVTKSFRSKYDAIAWRNNVDEFGLWCKGLTGYPLVDAGMRELNQTGYMHNRVRMVVASFLCKHLLIDWRWGEAYFAEKLLDYELASNNGNWQWAAGTGCDAAPYFRVFNPESQQMKFDSKMNYINRWVPELNSSRYPKPMVDHKLARQRALASYKAVLG